ncbi:sigma-70 family RNA polymerase sigma factor [Athalassotoga saccharophila]|uniref:sigma-70 family RNA polymerase sigma factor n=1 Tax=Athalassotoga saccharophila TaxID=1441386 RepID=UPI00137B18C3|nr:sigma-70 family RNA polymerase sigma factor [Athalassotoga saccharophila]
MRLKYRLRTRSTRELVKLAQSGVKEAADFIVEQFYPMVVKIAGQYYGQWSDQDDLIQNGLVGLIKAIYYYKEDKSTFSTFAWKSVDSEMKSFLTYLNRRKHRILTDSLKVDLLLEEESEDKSSDIGYEPTLIDEYLYEDLMSEISSVLDENEFELFKMYMQDESYKEMASRIGKNTKYVDNTIQKIKRKIKPVIETHNMIRKIVADIERM